MKKIALIPILFITFLLAYAIGYGQGEDSKAVELANEKQENIRLEKAFKKVQDRILTGATDNQDASIIRTRPTEEQYRLLELEQKMGKIETELFNQNLIRDGLAAR